DVLLLAELPAEAGSEVVDVEVKRRTHVIDDGRRHSELILDQALTIAVRVGGAVGRNGDLHAADVLGGGRKRGDARDSDPRVEVELAQSELALRIIAVRFTQSV